MTKDPSALIWRGREPGRQLAAAPVTPRPSPVLAGEASRGTQLGDALRETLELKYRRAASRGRTVVGDDELLMRLQEFGDEIDPAQTMKNRNDPASACSGWRRGSG